MSAGLTVVVDYGLCNLDSMARALEECGATSVEKSRDPRVVARADRVVLPGVGAFSAAMRNLRDWRLLDAIHEASAKNVPFLGACLGMQLMGSTGTEGGERVEGLGLVRADVVRLVSQSAEERVPHIGWNEVRPAGNATLFDDREEPGDFYFVHSYHMRLENTVAEAGWTPYCGGFTSAIELPGRPIFGTQFNPEKSQKTGFRLLKRFLAV
jgi:glutamine amidotransferase